MAKGETFKLSIINTCLLQIGSKHLFIMYFVFSIRHGCQINETRKLNFLKKYHVYFSVDCFLCSIRSKPFGARLSYLSSILVFGD